MADGQTSEKTDLKPSPWSAMTTRGRGRSVKMHSAKHWKVNRQASPRSDVTKQKAKGKVSPVFVTPIMSINGILIILVLKVPSACIIQSGQKRRASFTISGSVKKMA